MNIKEYLPLTELRFDILSELYQNQLNLVELSTRLNKSKQLIFQTLKLMNTILNKDVNNVYSISEDFLKIFENAIKLNLLQKRLGKYYDILPYIKKYAKPNEMFLFGSCARGEMNEKSDIDIYLISNESSKIIDEISLKLSKLMKVDVQIISVNSKLHLTKEDKYSDIYNKISKDITQGIKVDFELI